MQSKWKNNDVPFNDTCRERAWILEPTEENVALIAREKAEAVEHVVEMQRLLKASKAALPPADYAALQRCLDYQEQCVRVFRYHTEMFYRYRLFLLTTAPDRLDKLMAVVQRCAEEVRKLRAFDQTQADNAHSLVGNIKSLTWVKLCTSFSGPKGIVAGE